MAQPRVIGVGFEGRRRLGIVEQQIAAGPLDTLAAAAAQPAGATDPLLDVLAAVPMVEKSVVGRVDIDPDGERCLQEKALKVIRVKVSFTPASVWILLVTKWPMSVFSSR